MTKRTLSKLSTLILAAGLSGSLWAKPSTIPLPVPVPAPIPVPVPVPVPIPESKPKQKEPTKKPAPKPEPPKKNPPHKAKPQPKPQPRHVKPHTSHVEMSGWLKIRHRHGQDVYILETVHTDYILYPDEYSRHSVSYRDLDFYEDEYVQIEGYLDSHDNEISVTDIYRKRR